jgi:uncharacterized protein YndB with AHSA1/START domain
MAEPMKIIANPGETTMVITRVFDAPREVVFEAHAKCEHLEKWWGPSEYTLAACEMDFRPGGAYRFVHRGADGSEYAFRGQYREIVPPERLVYTFEFEGMPGHVSVETLTLTEEGGKTKATGTAIFDTVEDRDGMLQSGGDGMRETWDRLAEHVESMARGRTASATWEGALVIERVFDAPRELVWKAWTEPEHMKRWWGPKGFDAPAVEIDFRVGGKVLAAMRSPEFQDGRVLWSTGVYREIVPMERIVCTDSFADENGNVVPATYYGMEADMPLEMLITVTFEEHEGKTKMTLRHEGIPAGPERDGANEGWSQSFDKLADYLRTMR